MAERVKKSLTLGFSPYEYHGSAAPFEDIFEKTQNIKTQGFDGVDCVALWGGQDIHPSYYNQKHHPWSGAPSVPSERDIFEWKAMLYCKAKGIPLLGICRGAQFICAAAGGKLIQHMSGHGYDHHIDTIMGQRVKVTSTHHQMMYPFDVSHTLIGWCDPARCSSYEGEEGKIVRDMMKHQEPEIVYFPQVKGLAIQGHPEYGTASTEFVEMCKQLIETYLLPPF